MSEKKKPAQVIYVEEPIAGSDKKFHTKVGVLWAHATGGGYSVELLPGVALYGKNFVCFPYKENVKGEEAAA